jgi:aspartyl-tRNA(Asn)/glutamyl-tRNA(Gln) amidotransferase subunit A
LLKQWLDEVFGKVDLLQTPVFGAPTPNIADTGPDGPSPPTLGEFGRFTAPFSYLGLPSITVPIGFQRDGLPAGMQLIARPFAEERLLNAAHLYQRETGWHEKAPVVPQ